MTAQRETDSLHPSTLAPLPSGLALTPFEEYMLLDDTDDYPMSFHNWCRLVGPLNREVLDAALADAQFRHPLLRAQVTREGGRWQWRPTGGPPVQVIWTENGEPPNLLPRINLTQRAGLHAAASAQGEVSDICLQMHHSCCDGIGSVQFLRDWMLAYAARLEGLPSDAYWPPLDVGRLVRRSAPRLPWFRWPGFLAGQSVGLLGVRHFLANRPVSLVPAQLHAQGPASSAFVSRTLGSASFSGLLNHARSAGVTLNELVLRDLLVVLQAWRKEKGHERPADCLRIATPMNLRSPEDNRLPAANVVSLVFMDYQPADCAKPAELLRQLHKVMQTIKRHSLGWTFLASIAVARRFPDYLERSMRKPRCHATALMSNFGRLLDDWPLGKENGKIVSGNVILEHMDFVAVLRRQTNLGVVAHTYAGRLRLTAPYDRRVLTDEDANVLLDRLVERLQQTGSAQGVAA